MLIATRDNVCKEFTDAVYAAVKAWEQENKMIVDFDLEVHGIKLMDHELRKEIQKNNTKEEQK